jgi:putative flippase GtrA
MGNVTKAEQFEDNHKTLWQLIKFTFISMISGTVEFVAYFLINNVFLKSLNSEPFSWWIFNYSGGAAGGQGTMYAFFISTTLAQIIAFIVNRKKTFKANNNLLFSAIAYTLMVIVIICTQTYFGPLMVSAIDKIINNAGISAIIGKLIWMFFTFCTIFPMSKYVIMREKSVKA